MSLDGARDTVDLLWLVIPAAIVLFVLRTLMIARSLKAAAAQPTLADVRAFREAKRSLQAHHKELDSAVAAPKGHLESAKRLAAVPKVHAPERASRLPATAEDAVPDSPL